MLCEINSGTGCDAHIVVCFFLVGPEHMRTLLFCS